jgi:VWFA-related protein
MRVCGRTINGRYWGDEVKRAATALALSVCLILTFAVIRAQESAEQPAEIDKTEEVKVDLLLVDVLALDKKARTVSGLTKDDFQMTIAETPVSIDTFDVFCPEGGLDEPIQRSKLTETRPLGPDIPRRVVLAVDYHHIRPVNRGPVLSQAQAMVYNGKTDQEEIMVVSIADGLRIEQPFSRSRGQAMGTLNRMEHDVTLWERDFQGVSGRSYFDNLATLMDVLAQYDGAKAVVMFSEFMGSSSRSWDTWYTDVAERAANAQTAIYPVEAWGLSAGGSVGGSTGLARLANESGGRLTRNTNDLSLAYARAQRDLSCRYTLGHYLEPGEGRKQKKLRVYVRGDREGDVGQVRYPEVIRLWSDEQLKESRLRAAHADPGPFDNELIRSVVFPFSPKSAKAWDTVVAVHFDLPVDPGGTEITASATLLTGTKITGQYKASSHRIDPPKDGQADTRPVTLMGEGSVKPGDHRLNIVLSRPGDDRPHTTQALFTLPEVPSGELFFGGPFLARAVPDGVLIRGRESRSKKRSGPSPLEQIIGSDATFEPLFVYQIEPDDMLLAAWSACIVDGSLPTDATIERQVLTDDGDVVHELDALELEVPSKGKVRCHEELDSLPGGTLQPGEYTIKIAAKDGSGKELLSESIPLLVQ